MKLGSSGPRVGRSSGTAALVVATLLGVLVLALTAWSPTPGTTGSGTPARRGAGPTASSNAAGSSYELVQMNLCLSGLAGCYARAAYPAVVREAVRRIRRVEPEAVTLNEGCRRDVARIARRTGYHWRFSRVIYRGEPLRCVDPQGRGLFGDAVLTRAPVERSRHKAFQAQSGIEQRRWLCATTRRDVEVCTTHLNTRRTPTSAATNDAQCEELGELLARRAAVRVVVFGGDVNRRRSCAPEGFWTRTDRSAEQAPGVQHVYGSRPALRSASARVLPARHSDHDVLVVRARLVRPKAE